MVQVYRVKCAEHPRGDRVRVRGKNSEVAFTEIVVISTGIMWLSLGRRNEPRKIFAIQSWYLE